MPKYLNFFVNFITTLVVVCSINLLIVVPAFAVTQKLQFETSAGYKVKTTFSYDDTQTPDIIKERGKGESKNIDFLKVDFYNPSGKAIATYNNVVDRTVMGNYFEFNYDPATEQIIGNIDIGGESAGEMYLKGEAKGELTLIEITASGTEEVIKDKRTIVN